MKINITNLVLEYGYDASSEYEIMKNIVDNIIKLDLQISNMAYSLASIKIKDYLDMEYKNLFELISSTNPKNIANIVDIYLTGDKRYFIAYRALGIFSVDNYNCIYERRIETYYSVLLYKRVE